MHDNAHSQGLVFGRSFRRSKLLDVTDVLFRVHFDEKPASFRKLMCVFKNVPHIPAKLQTGGLLCRSLTENDLYGETVFPRIHRQQRFSRFPKTHCPSVVLSIEREVAFGPIVLCHETL